MTCPCSVSHHKSTETGPDSDLLVPIAARRDFGIRCPPPRAHTPQPAREGRAGNYRCRFVPRSVVARFRSIPAAAQLNVIVKSETEIKVGETESEECKGILLTTSRDVMRDNHFRAQARNHTLLAQMAFFVASFIVLTWTQRAPRFSCSNCATMRPRQILSSCSCAASVDSSWSSIGSAVILKSCNTGAMSSRIKGRRRQAAAGECNLGIQAREVW